MPTKAFKNSSVTEMYKPFELSVPHSMNDDKLLGCRFNWDVTASAFFSIFSSFFFTRSPFVFPSC